MPRRLSLGLALLLGLLSLACAKPAFTHPQVGGPDWTQVTSERFVVVTDLSAAAARRASESLERIDHFMRTVAFPFSRQPTARTNVVLFRNGEEYESIAPAWTAGVHLRQVTLYGSSGAIFINGDVEGAGRLIAAHEIAHGYISYHYPSAPIWLQEGLAQYLETFRVEGDKARLGAPLPPERLPWGGLTSLQSLMAMSPEVFTLAGHHDMDQRVAFGRMQNYASAWTLVHILMDRPTLRPGFDKYLGELREGGLTRSQSWQRAHKHIPRSVAEPYYDELARGGTVPVLVVGYEAPILSSIASRTLDDHEVFLKWGELFLSASLPQHDKARGYIEEAHALRPSPASHVLRARHFLATGDLGLAKEECLAALTLERTYAPALHLVAALQVAATEATNDEQVVAEARAYVSWLEKVATSADEWALIAKYYFLQSQLTRAKRATEKSLNLDTGCFHGWKVAGDIFASDGKPRRAISAYTSAAALFPHDQTPPFLNKLIGDLEASLKNPNPPMAGTLLEERELDAEPQSGASDTKGESGQPEAGSEFDEEPAPDAHDVQPAPDAE